jgi:DNA-binding transcriptional MerR regulator
MPKRAIANPAALHPIQIVTRRTGLSADVLRVWEKRYAVVTPVRSASDRRLYSDADIERLRLLVEVTRTGRTIGQIAALDNAALRGLLAEESRSVVKPRAEATEAVLHAPPAGADLLEECLAAISRFDAVALDLLLRRAIVALSADDFLDVVAVPLIEHLRLHTPDSALRRPHAHLALAVLRRVLDHIVATATAPLASRDLVVATLGGPAQELDALVVAAVAAADGWRVTFVGPGAPADDVAELVKHVGAGVLALSVAGATGGRMVPRELHRLRTLLPARVELLVVALTANTPRAVLGEPGAAPLIGLDMLRARLRALRAARQRQPRVTRVRETLRG